ncbi:hypothetical protein E3A20_12690 [Planctomyces bekefii]|uniref:Uncharacterized protein n=1 Tax=Planctomyces bekefii TaxID=1653850 RepID=A0A5C6M5V9_9PLAN|nr:hypothetical protein E3A20_12690 [Planctomyces bekefii]
MRLTIRGEWVPYSFGIYIWIFAGICAPLALFSTSLRAEAECDWLEAPHRGEPLARYVNAFQAGRSENAEGLLGRVIRSPKNENQFETLTASNRNIAFLMEETSLERLSGKSPAMILELLAYPKDQIPDYLARYDFKLVVFRETSMKDPVLATWENVISMVEQLAREGRYGARDRETAESIRQYLPEFRNHTYKEIVERGDPGLISARKLLERESVGRTSAILPHSSVSALIPPCLAGHDLVDRQRLTLLGSGHPDRPHQFI